MTGHPNCANTPKAVFFPTVNLPYTAVAQYRVNKAKQVCEGCPCQLECYQTAVANQERHGVWGGVDFNNRTYGRQLKPCGTNAAYERHKYNGETPCQECVKARNEHRKQEHNRRRGNG